MTQPDLIASPNLNCWLKYHVQNSLFFVSGRVNVTSTINIWWVLRSLFKVSLVSLKIKVPQISLSLFVTSSHYLLGLFWKIVFSHKHYLSRHTLSLLLFDWVWYLQKVPISFMSGQRTQMTFKDPIYESLKFWWLFFFLFFFFLFFFFWKNTVFFFEKFLLAFFFWSFAGNNLIFTRSSRIVLHFKIQRIIQRLGLCEIN